MTYQYFNIIFATIQVQVINEKASISRLLQQANLHRHQFHYHAVTKLSSAPPFVTLGE